MWIITTYSFILLVVLIAATIWVIGHVDRKTKNKNKSVDRYL
jgi:hypothetical protein